jgi:hypothetical protein
MRDKNVEWDDGGLYPNRAVIFKESGMPAEYVFKNPFFHRSLIGGSDLGCMVLIYIHLYIFVLLEDMMLVAW